jgi:hypothetical protein
MAKPTKPEKQMPEAAQSPVTEEEQNSSNGNGYVDPFEGVEMLEGTGPFAGLSVGFAMLTGETADIFPEETPFQRKTSKRTSFKYARLQTEGKWINEYPAPFILDKDGNILDGGHRKGSVKLSRKPIAVLLLKGMSHKAVHAVDRPKPRSLAGNLAWDGKNAPNQLSQMLRFHKSWEESGTFKDFAGYDVPDYYDVLEQHPGMETIAPRWVIKPNLPKVPTGLFAIAEYLISELAKEDPHDFLMDCARGEALVEGDPAFAFREWVLNLLPKRTTAITAKIGYTLIYCWDKHRRGLQVHKLRGTAGCPEISPLEGAI